MFEGKLPVTIADPAEETGATRPLAWDELVARLAAARDLRAVFAAARADSEASFAGGAARALAPAVPGETQCKASVNPAALGAGKGTWTTTAVAARDMGDCDREMR